MFFSMCVPSTVPTPVARFTQACREADIKKCVIASLMGISVEMLSKQLHNKGHLSLQRLLMLRDDPDGRRFLRCYWPLVAVDMGLDDVVDWIDAVDKTKAFGKIVDQIQIKMARIVELDSCAECQRQKKVLL